MKIRLLLACLLVPGLVLSACAKPAQAPPPIPSTEEGKAIYAQKCASCHGVAGEGTATGPAIAGRNTAATKTLVRNPIGSMPAFPVSQLSESDLDELAEFVAGIGIAESPMTEEEKTATDTIPLECAEVC